MAEPATAACVAVPISTVQEVRHRLRTRHRLEVDVATAAYIVRRLEADDEEMLNFPASDSDSGTWAFRVLPAARLRQ